MTDTTHKAPDLLPCPFCGGEASCFEDSSHYTAWEIGCFNGKCAAEPHVWEKTKQEAITAWNTRSDDLAQQDDDDFHPATAGDDPIWLGGVEYITKSRSDDLVQVAVAAALTEADQAIQSVAANCTTEDGHVAIVAAVEKVRSLITPDAQAALDRYVKQITRSERSE